MAELPAQTEVVVVDIATVGGGTTLIVTEPVAGCVQAGTPGDVTLTNVKVVVVE